MNIVDRFLAYTQFDTQSAEDAGKTPSTDKQMTFARYLREELIEIGLKDVELDDEGYLYATLPSNTKKKAPTIGFIAHMDTSPDASGANIKPRIVKNYDGTDIVLDAAAGIVTSVEKFPELKRHIGEDIIVTDGHTLLGADDKAGIAEIVQAMVYLMEHPEIEHGKIRVGFNPDEEIGLGAHKFDVEKFGCEWAYTMDGSELGELEFENFNAAVAKVDITGVSVHPGYAKDKMINACRVATDFIGLLPANEVPEKTDGYQGFFHLIGMEGGVEKASLTYIIRDHDRQKFEDRKKLIIEAGEKINAQYGEGTINLIVKDQYYNMQEIIKNHMNVVEIAQKAMKNVGVKPVIEPIRGGTDGSKISFKGLPTPNIFAGGENFHGKYEFVALESMILAADVIVEIVRLNGEGE